MVVHSQTTGIGFERTCKQFSSCIRFTRERIRKLETNDEYERGFFVILSGRSACFERHFFWGKVKVCNCFLGIGIKRNLGVLGGTLDMRCSGTRTEKDETYKSIVILLLR